MSAGAYTGTDLQKWCAPDSHTFDGGLCIGYISGANEFYNLMVWSGVVQQRAYCIPDGVKNNQVQQIISKYLGNNPETLHMEAPMLFFAAMVKAFPCVTPGTSGK